MSSRTKIIKPDFNKVTIGLFSPKDILNRSCGEVIEPETKNHRTYKSEEAGLYCPKIFGPEENWKCSCGKYKGIKYRGNVCDRCGVEINQKSVRRDRIGHIRLTVPVVHPWFFKHHPNVIGSILGFNAKKLENIIYYSSYIVIQPGTKEGEVSKMDCLTAKEYQKHLDSLPSNHLLSDSSPQKFIAKMGAEAIKELLKKINIDDLSVTLRDKIKNETSQQRRKEAIKRLVVVESFREASRNGIKNKPEWMILEYIPVMSPARHPIVNLTNGRFVTSDYTRQLQHLLISNSRLVRLIDMQAPEIITLNEKRILQNRVDALMNSSTDSSASITERGRTLKSISDLLKGKTGHFRNNMLGKRVDYSGRSVITVGPHLKLHECGLPKSMALILFAPFVIQKLKDRGVINFFKEGKELIEEKAPIVWAILEKIVKSHPVLLNRAPTLHRLGIQAFYAKLHEGKSIQLHPLVCTAFNADFDGDQMAVHLPLGQKAKVEADMLLLASKNILNPSNGRPIMVPTKDMIHGLYYLTKGRKGTPTNPVKGEGMIFSGVPEVIIALNNKKVSKNAHIKLYLKNKEGRGHIIDTVAGRALFNQYIPTGINFVNETINSKNIHTIVTDVYNHVSMEQTAQFLDNVKTLGFKYAYKGGLTFGLDDMKPPKRKKEIIENANKEIEQIQENYYMGFITDMERYNQTIDVWTKVNIIITKDLLEELKEDQQGFNSIHLMKASGARGSADQIKQLCGLRGLMSKPQKRANDKGNTIEYPILASFLDGLSPAEYFLSAHGSRTGLTYATLKTADAGYFTLKTADVAQAVVITEKDCRTLRGRTVTPIYQNGRLAITIGSQILSRTLAQDVIDPNNKQIIFKKGQQIGKKETEKIDELSLVSLQVRSPIHCETQTGICIQCYGTNLGNNKLAVIGDAVGIIAAHSISEQGTQFTLRTFHGGGSVTGGVTEDTIKALEEGIVKITNLKTVLFENNHIVINRNCELKVIEKKTQEEIQSYIIPYGAMLLVKDKEKVTKLQTLFKHDPYNKRVLSHVSGKVTFEAIEAGVTYKEEYNRQTGHKEKIIIASQDKHKVPGIIIDDGKGNKVSYIIPINAQLHVEESEEVQPGTILAKISLTRNKPRDIVGGLPLITKLFEMHNTINKAVVTAIDGQVSYGSQKRGNLEIIVTSKENIQKKYKVSLAKQTLVQEGDYVKVGDPLSDGIISGEDILKIKGLGSFCDHILRGVQSVYRGQGICINDKHIEIILRQMLQKVQIQDAGDTNLIPDKMVSKEVFNKANEDIHNKKVIIDKGDTRFKEGQVLSTYKVNLENESIEKNNLKPAKVRNAQFAIAHTIAQGITAASITSPSFLASAAFQRTVKILVNATIKGKIDNLEGMKENVLVGKLITAGTGMSINRMIRVSSKEVKQTLEAEKEQHTK